MMPLAMTMPALPDQVDAVVIGSGALGGATAFYLAQAGLKVALLDKAAIASQTSPRAAGLSGTLRSDDLMTEIAADGVRRIASFQADTGEPLSFHQPGSLKVARRDDHAEQLEDEVKRGRRLGLDVDLVSLDRARALMPYLQTDGVRGVMHMRTDVYLEPRQIPDGYARACARLGAVLLPHTSVDEIVMEAGLVAGVQTARGSIRTTTVVDAAGGWLRQVASRGGASIGLISTRHQLMVTVPLPGVRPEQPITRIIDANVYIRPEQGGLMLGGYEPDPLQIDVADKEPFFDISDMPLDLGVLRRLARSIEAQFPVFRDVAIQDHRGGLPTMTADGQHVLGPVPGVSGLWVIGGCCVGGLTTAPALGALLSGWIVEGQPSMDLSSMAPDRVATRLPEPELRERCRTQYAHHYWSPASMLEAG